MTEREFAGVQPSEEDLMVTRVDCDLELGDLLRLSTDTVATLNKVQQAFMDAEMFGYGIAEGTIPELMATKMDEKVREGLNFKFLLPENRFPSAKSLNKVPKNVQMHSLPELPAVVACTEKFASICFLQIGGKVDYAGFLGDDPTFVNWVKELFMHY